MIFFRRLAWILIAIGTLTLCGCDSADVLPFDAETFPFDVAVLCCCAWVCVLAWAFAWEAHFISKGRQDGQSEERG